MGKKDKITADPMTQFRKQQKNKEKKRAKINHTKGSTSRLADADPTELRDQIRKLEREEQNGTLDGASRQKKNDLEESLRKVLKQRAEVDAETKARQIPSTIKSAKELASLNAKTYKNPEQSEHYHPVFNPFGVAPPPGHTAPSVSAFMGGSVNLRNEMPGQPPLPKGPRPKLKNKHRPPLPKGPPPFRPPPPPPTYQNSALPPPMINPTTFPPPPQHPIHPSSATVPFHQPPPPPPPVRQTTFERPPTTYTSEQRVQSSTHATIASRHPTQTAQRAPHSSNQQHTPQHTPSNNTHPSASSNSHGTNKDYASFMEEMKALGAI